SKKYHKLLEYICGCGIIENYQDNHAIYAYNAIDDDNYKLDIDKICITSIDSPIHENLKRKLTLGFILHETDSFFQKQFSTECGFYLTEKIDDASNYTIYFFTSFDPDIYQKIVNEQELVKGFVNFFKEHNDHILKIFSQIKKDFGKQLDKYYKEPNNLRYVSSKDSLLVILKYLGMLKDNADLTKEEAEFIEVYNYGELYNVDMSHIYGISQDDMQEKFNKISHKMLKK
ncbi:MAG: hypothetical protein HRT87_11745, partial [Legionellales bacterium]|nr:hypothetical protein [Legionellales bacterium]